MIELKAPDIDYLPNDKAPSLFLGGSIEMGKAEKWQDRVTAEMANVRGTIYNPRRDDWDSSWVQDPTPGTQFHTQVSWEIDNQTKADIKVYYFAKDTMSPITLLELGSFGHASDTVVYVDPAYERRGNVIIHCNHFKIYWTETFGEFMAGIDSKVADWHYDRVAY